MIKKKMILNQQLVIGQYSINKLQKHPKKEEQENMRRNIGKSVSNLDLKLLDVKFISINDNQTYLTEALHQAKRAKKGQYLPSLLMSKDNNNQTNEIVDETTIIEKFDKEKTPKNIKIRQTLQTSDYTDQSMMLGHQQNQHSHSYPNNSIVISLLQPKSNEHQQQHQQQAENEQLQQVKELVRIRRSQQLSLHNSSTNMLSQSQSRAELQEKELQKYRRKIQLIKKENQIIHNQISLLYRNKISQNKEQFKKVKNIEPFKMESFKTQAETKNPFALNKQIHRKSEQVLRINKNSESQKLKSSNKTFSQLKRILTENNDLTPLIYQKANFYENLGSDSPYKQELEEIHRKMISNNFHKNFQQYLNSANKRIPQFIKKLKN